MINILFAAVTERWDQYEKPLKKQLDLLSLKYKLAENLPPDEVDYIIFSFY
jgi:glyoxylate/hydroxypyruvate reductase A